MKKIKPRFLFVLILFSFVSSTFAENGLWAEGKDHPGEKVNVGLKALTPDAYIRVSELVDEAVVNINTTQTIRVPRLGNRGLRREPRRNPGEPGNPFGDFFGDDLFDRFFGGPQQDTKQKSLGSGFILNSEGYIATNNHVVEKADDIKVVLYDESEYTAKVVGRDPKTDVALLKISAPKRKLKRLILGDSSQLKVGEIVLAVGNPFGLSHSLTHGIVSAKERSIGFGNYDDFIQTDASINPGNSGGPLLNLQGEVVGINAAIVASGQGIGFAIPINLAKNILLKLKNQGKVVRGWLGVLIQKIGDEHVAPLKLKDKKGALVSDVVKGSPAEKGGIRPGDVIVRYDGKEIRESNDLPIQVANTDIKKKIKVDVVRDGKPITLDVEIAEMKAEDEQELAGTQEQKSDLIGLTVQNLTPEIAASMGLDRNTKGVVVTNVENNSAAYEQGVRPGDVIVEVDKKRVTEVASYRGVIAKKRKGDSILLLVKRGEGITLYIAFTL